MLKKQVECDLIETIVAEPLALSLRWKGDKLVELQLRRSTAVTESVTLTEDAKALKTALARYISGEMPNWPDLPYDFSNLTEFQQTVLEALYRVPSGTTCTYGELATAIGNPNASRAIGRAMATNPFPMVYP